MPCPVDRADGKLARREVDLVDRTGVLPEPPIMRQRQIERVQQDDAVDAVVPDQHDRFPRMLPDRISQCRNCASEHILQALATRDRRPMRRPVPGVERVGPFAPDLVWGQTLPLAVVDIHQTRERGRGQAERSSDRLRGCPAPAQGAGIEGSGRPARLYAARGRLRLPEALRSQRQIGAAAKALRRDAFDVAVANQDDLGHAVILSRSAG